MAHWLLRSQGELRRYAEYVFNTYDTRDTGSITPLQFRCAYFVLFGEAPPEALYRVVLDCSALPGDERGGDVVSRSVTCHDPAGSSTTSPLAGAPPSFWAFVLQQQSTGDPSIESEKHSRSSSRSLPTAGSPNEVVHGDGCIPKDLFLRCVTHVYTSRRCGVAAGEMADGMRGGFGGSPAVDPGQMDRALGSASRELRALDWEVFDALARGKGYITCHDVEMALTDNVTRHRLPVDNDRDRRALRRVFEARGRDQDERLLFADFERVMAEARSRA